MVRLLLYRNQGGGRFEDVTARAGLSDPTDKAMGVAVIDYNMDGWSDLFIGSDRVPAKLYRNDGQGSFVEEGLRMGVALSENGAARANMGVDAADYDRSGRPHIVVGNFHNEMLGLYHNEDGDFFVDVAPRTEVGRASLPVRDVGCVLPGLRPRRLSRYLRRQRRDQGVARDGSAGAIEPATAPAPEQRQRYL